ncbi:MAG: AraC family transcriptional regulator [Candidatus Omnitrophica bacterium]|nr:AraC family transcriptional regulator [Candidatus Omnitrophota bacterium]
MGTVPEAHSGKLSNLSWLVEVRELSQPLSELRPIWVQQGIIETDAQHPLPQQHPFCELNLTLSGQGPLFLGKEEAYRRAGDLLMLGPGVPHWGKLDEGPVRFLTVYFLPSLLLEFGPETDGIRFLRRFTAKQSLQERVVCPTPELRSRLTGLFIDIAAEFAGERLGREFRLRSILMELLTELLRWEELEGRTVAGLGDVTDWRFIHKALLYLRIHFAEPVYERDVAAAAGVCQSRLREIFRQTLGMSWVRYLQIYRIHQAAALLSQPDSNVTEAALSVGFDHLGHFNRLFRLFKGTSPMHFKKSIMQSCGGLTGAAEAAPALQAKGTVSGEKA